MTGSLTEISYDNAQQGSYENQCLCFGKTDGGMICTGSFTLHVCNFATDVPITDKFIEESLDEEEDE